MEKVFKSFVTLKQRNVCLVHIKDLPDFDSLLVWSTAELQLVYDHFKIIFPMEKFAK